MAENVSEQMKEAIELEKLTGRRSKYFRRYFDFAASFDFPLLNFASA